MTHTTHPLDLRIARLDPCFSGFQMGGKSQVNMAPFVFRGVHSKDTSPTLVRNFFPLKTKAFQSAMTNPLRINKLERQKRTETTELLRPAWSNVPLPETFGAKRKERKHPWGIKELVMLRIPTVRSILEIYHTCGRFISFPFKAPLFCESPWRPNHHAALQRIFGLSVANIDIRSARNDNEHGVLHGTLVHNRISCFREWYREPKSPHPRWMRWTVEMMLIPNGPPQKKTYRNYIILLVTLYMIIPILIINWV